MLLALTILSTVGTVICALTGVWVLMRKRGTKPQAERRTQPPVVVIVVPVVIDVRGVQAPAHARARDSKANPMRREPRRVENRTIPDMITCRARTQGPGKVVKWGCDLRCRD